MRGNNMRLPMTLALLPLAFTGCEQKEEITTVDWYMAPENEAAFEVKLKECRNNNGSWELRSTARMRS